MSWQKDNDIKVISDNRHSNMPTTSTVKSHYQFMYADFMLKGSYEYYISSTQAYRIYTGHMISSVEHSELTALIFKGIIC